MVVIIIPLVAKFTGTQREDLDLAASAGNNNNNNNNQRFRWQEPPGKIIFVLFCFDTRRDEEKETQNINVVGKIPPPRWGRLKKSLADPPGKYYFFKSSPNFDLISTVSDGFRGFPTVSKAFPTFSDDFQWFPMVPDAFRSILALSRWFRLCFDPYPTSFSSKTSISCNFCRLRPSF